MTTQEERHVLDEVGKANEMAAKILEILGDSRTPDGQGWEGMDQADKILDSLSTLEQRLGFITDVVCKL